MDVDALPALYLDALSATPGQRISVHANGEGNARCSLVRLRGLVGAPMPTAYDETQVIAPVTVPLAVRAVPMGSFATTDAGPAAARGRSWEWTLRCLPTLVDRGEIMAWGEGGPRLSLHEGELRLAWGAAMVSVPIAAGFWWEVKASWSSERGLGLLVHPVAAGAWHRSAAFGHVAAPADVGSPGTELEFAL